jgi:hypothetical protein
MEEQRLEALRQRLEEGISSLRERFYDTFRFVTTG